MQNANQASERLNLWIRLRGYKAALDEWNKLLAGRRLQWVEVGEIPDPEDDGLA